MSIHLSRALDMVELCGALGLAAVPRVPTLSMVAAGKAVLDVDGATLATAFTSMIDSATRE